MKMMVKILARSMVTMMVVASLIALTISSVHGYVEREPALFDPVPDADFNSIYGYFIGNSGQWDSSFLFRTSSPEVDIGIFSDRLILNLIQVRDGAGTRGRSLQYEFIGSNGVNCQGIDEMEHRSNFFIGDDETSWVRA